MADDLSGLDEAQLYDHLRTVWNAAREKYEGASADSATAFQDGAGRVNMLGGRGLKDGKAVTKNSNDTWDDTLFLIWKEAGGAKRVSSFVYSSEFGTEGTALLVLGFHKYLLNFHHKDRTHKSLADMSKYASSKYRALNPFAGVKVWRDKDRDLQQDANEKYDAKPNWSINIHFGGDAAVGPQNWSEGCQVLKGWDNYKEFIKRIESDASIKGSIDNELADKPGADGTRPLIYLLLSGAEVLQETSVAASFPLDLGGGRQVDEETVKAFYKHTEVDTPHGFFPLGENTTWHGGVHLYGRKGDTVHACLQGTIVCARLGDTDETGAGAYGSYNFVLLRHELSAGACYSLYMHLGQVKLDASNAELKPFAWLGAGGRTGFKMKEYVNFREDPGETKICVLTPGDELDVVDPKPVRKGSNDWYKVRGRKVAKKEGQGKTGWVAYAAKWMDDLRSSPDEALLKELAKGDVVALDAKVAAGAPLWTLGEYWGEGEEGRPRLVHWEIFSEGLLFPEFSKAEDSDSDFNMDCKKILEMVEQEFFGSDDILTAEEIRDFYKKSEDAKTLRTTACKFISEWGVDIEKAIENLKGLKGYLTWGMADRIRPYCWWHQAKGVTLPRPHVWHYNPIAVLEALAAGGGVAAGSEGESESEDSNQVLKAAEKLRDGKYSDWTYGHDASKKQVDCVQYIEAVLKEVGVPVAGAVHTRVCITDVKAEELQDLVEKEDEKIRGVQQALLDARKGTKVSPSDAKEGDLIQYWYKHDDAWAGHQSVLEKVKTEGGVVKAQLLGAHSSLGKVGTANFGWLKLTNTSKKIYLVRYKA